MVLYPYYNLYNNCKLFVMFFVHVVRILFKIMKNQLCVSRTEKRTTEPWYRAQQYSQ